MRTIVAFITDLLFQSRVREQAAALGYQFVVADTDAALRDALATGPCLVVIDLHIAAWRDAVVAAKDRGVPILAFGRHTAPDLLRAAREAGCDRVVVRSTFVEKLPELLSATADALREGHA